MKNVVLAVTVAATLMGCGAGGDGGSTSGKTPAVEACRIATLDAAVPAQRTAMTQWAQKALSGGSKQAGVSPELNRAATTLALGLAAPGPTVPPEGIKAMQAKVVAACSK